MMQCNHMEMKWLNAFLSSNTPVAFARAFREVGVERPPVYMIAPHLG